MKRKKFATPNTFFAAQAKSEPKASANTRKAWRQASRNGMSAMGMLGMLVYICFMLQYLVGIENEICKKFHAQHPEIIFECRAAKKCHQGQFSTQTAYKVHKFIMTNKYTNLVNVNT